jgi:hypothetical protein
VEIDGTFHDGPDIEEKSTYNPAAEVGVGVGVVIPLTGTLIAADIVNYSAPDTSDMDKFDPNELNTYNDLHLGIEQGVLFNTVMLRMGYYNDGPSQDSYYTYGLGVYLGQLNIGVAAANSQNDMNNSLAMAQIGATF